MVDQRAGGIISDNACGYATNTNSGPWVANSVMSWPTITDIWPKTEKIMNPDISDVKLNQKMLLRFTVVFIFAITYHFAGFNI